MAATKRLHYLDLARGLAMLTIVMAHTVATATHNYYLYRFLFSFCVPIFFLISGFTFKIKPGETFWAFAKQKFIRIMLPYLIWSTLFLIPYLFFGQQVGAELSQSSSFNLWQQLGNILYGNGTASALKQNSPLWFLPALFSTELLYYGVCKFVKTKKAEIIALLIILLTGFGFSLLAPTFILPWGINSALTIGIFFFGGYLLRKYQLLEKEPRWLQLLSLVITILIGFIALHFSSINNVVWSDYLYNNYWLMLIAGIAFSYALLIIAKLWDHNRLLEYIGCNTMAILIFHKIIVVVCQAKLGPISQWLANSNWYTELGIAILVVGIATSVSLGIGAVIQKIYPPLLGIKKKD